VITVVFRSAFIRPHGGLLSNQTAFLESQPIHTIQEVLRRTLRPPDPPKNQPIATLSITYKNSEGYGEWMVADAVTVEPVSILKFPANREINREFPVLWRKRHKPFPRQ
jgi:hypothetical protein